MSYIVTGSYQWTISMPYKAGHVLTDVEANALNWYRADLIQKTVEKIVKKAMNAHPDEMLSFDEAAEIQRKVTAISMTYMLAHRKPPQPSFLDREAEALAIATLRKQGNHSPSPDEVAFLKRTREIQDQARQLIDIRFAELINGAPDAPDAA